MMNRILQIAVLSTASLFALAAVAEEGDAKASDEAAPETGIVITNEGMVEKCILPLVITEVDGKAVEKDSGHYELAAGKHTFNGHAREGDYMACETIVAVNLSADGLVGSGSSTTIDLPAGKEYFLGFDLRKQDPKTWKIVTWRINH
jgi:hypothetical protein